MSDASGLTAVTRRHHVSQLPIPKTLGALFARDAGIYTIIQIMQYGSGVRSLRSGIIRVLRPISRLQGGPMDKHVTPTRQAFDVGRMEELSRSISAEWYGGCVGHRDRDDGDFSPFVRAVVDYIRIFVSCVDMADFRMREQFQQAMWTLVQFGVSEAKIAQVFETTANAVNRWANGRSSPTPVMRKSVIHASLNILMEDGVKIAGRRYHPVTGTEIHMAERTSALS